MPSDLEHEFKEHVIKYCDRFHDEIGRNPVGLRGSVTRNGAVGAVQNLFNKSSPSPSFSELRDKDRLDLSMEAAVLEHHRYYELFTPLQLEKAKKWLTDAGYFDKKD